MTQEDAIVYNVQINGQQRKAFDAIALKRFLEGQKLNYSALSLNPADIDPDEPIINYVAKAAIETLKDLEDAVDQALGLVPELPDGAAEQPVQEPVSEAPETPSEVINVEKEVQKAKETAKVQDAESDDEPDESVNNEETEERIVL